MIGIPIGIFYANCAEALFHRYVLHGLGKNPNSFWAFHWREHHRTSRQNDFYDHAYKRAPFRSLDAYTKELLAVAASLVAHLPLFPVAPFFVSTLAVCSVKYHRAHRKAHLDPQWARENMPWHYDHHMGPNQECNWGVVKPWYDELMRTRVRYVGTEQERRDNDRRVAKRRQSAP